MANNGRPSYTARPGEAIRVLREDDGSFGIGAGRIKIASDDIRWVTEVIGDLSRIVHTQEGEELLRRGDELGRPVTIIRPEPPTEPPNAWILSVDLTVATAGGRGTGCGSKIFYNPADWPRKGDPSTPSSDAVLLTMLRQANLNAVGNSASSVGDWGTKHEQTSMSDPAAGANLRLNCQPSKAGNLLIFLYTIENLGPGDVYAMHALPSTDSMNKEARADVTAAVVIADDSGDAIVGKFVTPLPTDRQIALPVFPLARRVPGGGSLEGRIEIPLPLAETSPYFADLTLRGYEIIDIKGIQLMIGYWPAASEDLVVRQSEYAPELLTVLGANLPGRSARVSRRFPTTGLQLFKRTDAFPRSLGSAP